LTTASSATPRAPRQPFRATHATTRGIQRQRAQQTALKTVAEINAMGMVFNPGGVNLYAKPNTTGKDKPTGRLQFNAKALVVRELEGGWYQVSVLGGGTGYVNKTFMRVYKDDPGANLHVVKAGQSALGVAEQYYGRFVQPGMDLRYFVNVLAHVNPSALKKPGSSNWKEVAFNQNTVIRVPGVQYALSLRSKVDDGSLTNGMYAKVTGSLGRIGDLTKSVLESPQFVGEVLGDLWEVIKPQLPQFIAITAALIAAELTVAALAAIPEPTLITKVIAMLLQGAILLFAGYGAAVSLYSAITEGATWIKTAWNANGKYAQVKLASKAFLRMLGSIALAVLAIMGVRGSLGRFTKLYAKYKTKLPVVQETPVVAPRNPSPNQGAQKPGLETRGYKPKPGERSQTRDQYNADPKNAQGGMGRLSKLLGEETMRRIGGRLSQQQLEAFIKELGVAGTRQIVSKFGPEAMAEYGAAFFKSFRGVTSNTMRHLIQNDGIQSGAIKGCHDKAEFLHELTSPTRVTTAGNPTPLGQVLSITPHPSNPSISTYFYRIFARNGALTIIDPPQLLSGGTIPKKTVIDGLISKTNFWQNLARIAVEKAIRYKNYNASTKMFTVEYAGLTVQGYIRNGEVSTFYIVW
jgi:hypothetical protein